MVQPDFNSIKHPWKCPSPTRSCGSADKNVRISPNPGVRRCRINAVTDNYFYLLAPISPGINGPTVFWTEAVWIVSFLCFLLSKIFSPHPCLFYVFPSPVLVTVWLLTPHRVILYSNIFQLPEFFFFFFLCLSSSELGLQKSGFSLLNSFFFP